MIGRFINADEADVLSGDHENFAQYNLYAYCWNNPVNMTDDGGTWPSWLKKAVAVVAVATTIVAATVVTAVTCGAGLVAGVAMISATASMAARATEVAALQIKKGKQEGKSGSQIAKDTMESIYDNGSKIVGITPAVKIGGVSYKHIKYTMGAAAKGVKHTVKDTLKTTGKKKVAYAFVAYAWFNTVRSAFSSDPVAKAKKRGYVLK